MGYLTGMAPTTLDGGRAGEMRFELSCASLPDWRDEVARWLGERAGAPGTVNDAVIALSELLTNACEHGADGRIDVACTATASGVSLSVSNSVDRDVVLPEPDEWKMPDPMAQRGRGLAIVAAVSDRVVLDRAATRVCVEAHFDLTG